MDKFSNNALQETERLNTLVNDLLLSAKLESAYQPLTEEIHLQELLEGIIHKLETKYPNARFTFDHEDIPYILGDRLGLTSVALNLLENAIKYSSNEPKIHVLLNQEDDRILLSIADNGIGISDKEKKKIFEKFYRVGNEDTRQTKGTGLGLYIVNQIIKAHHGQIRVLDNQPKGTIFRIILPIEHLEQDSKNSLQYDAHTFGRR